LKQPIDILNPLVAEMLKSIEDVLRANKVDYYLVGAMARDIRLSVREGFEAKRKTNDVDIAVLLSNENQFYDIIDALKATSLFEQSDASVFKLIFKEAIEVDLLPYGDIENNDRQLTLSKHTFLVMDMSGFKEVHSFKEELTVAEGISLSVCSLEGLVILKLIANNINPDRTKDIIDIEHILEVYFELNANEIYEDFMGVMELYDTTINNYLTLVSARIIGRKMKNILLNSTATHQLIKNILAKRPVDIWHAMLEGISE
jgi:predicted nucleotidyltransferase